MDSSFWFDTINLGWSIVYIEGPNVIISPLYIQFNSNLYSDCQIHFSAATEHLIRDKTTQYYYYDYIYLRYFGRGNWTTGMEKQCSVQNSSTI